MKYLPLFGLLAVVLTGCDKLTHFPMNYSTYFTISSTTVVNLPVSVSTPEVETESESTFAHHNTRADLIERIWLRRATLRVESPSNGDFSFIERLDVYLRAEGLPEILVAWAHDIPAGEDEIDIDVIEDDLRAYLLAERFTIRTETTTDEVITQNYQIECETDFMVDAKVLGI